MHTDDIFIPGWQEKEIKLISFEEGWCDQPYVCSAGYPTVGFGFRIGPKGANLENYNIQLPRLVGEFWLTSILESVADEMLQHPAITSALKSCNDARQAILLSIAYQLGVSDLCQCRTILSAIQDRRWLDARDEILDSQWAEQSPKRAQRHAEQVLTGSWYPRYEI